VKAVLSILFALILSGCSNLMVSNLGAAPTIDTRSIIVIDKRSPEQKESKRDSALAPLVVLGDENVQPPALLFLQSALLKNQKNTSQFKIEVNEFYVIDFFPKRLRAATRQGGWLTDAITEKLIQSKTDWSFVNNAGVPSDGDSIVCLFSGTINGKPVKVAAYSQYFTSPTTLSIRNDQAFVNAVKSAIDKTAKEMLAKIEV